MAQVKRVPFNSGSGRAQYPWLNEPDTAFGNDPRYKTNLIADDASALIAKIEALAEEEFGKDWKKVRMPFVRDEDTGEVILKTKSKYAPLFYDSAGSDLVGQQVPKLWGGSVIKIGGYMVPYTVSGSKGISLQLTKVQVINPVSSGEKKDGGFEAVEGGYVADDIMQEAFDNDEEETTTPDRF